MILKYTLIVFVTQLIFIGCRTWNVRAVANGDLKAVLISGGLVHLSWLVSIAIGSISMHTILTNFDWNQLPIIMASLIGGLIGSWIGLKNKKPKHKIIEETDIKLYCFDCQIETPVLEINKNHYCKNCRLKHFKK